MQPSDSAREMHEDDRHERDAAASETERVAALRSYDILDTAPEADYDAVTQLAAAICRTPFALVSFVDAERQWIKSCVGSMVANVSRNLSFCAHALHASDVLVVPDATTDERFRGNPLVMGAPGIRFYAGAPLTTADGHTLGTLCVIDREPRELSANQLEALRVLARQVVRMLELRRRTSELIKANSALEAEINRREAAEAERLRSYDELEMRVRERTADLRTANDFLREQIEERKRLFESVVAGKRVWEGTFDAIEQGVLVCDAAGRVSRCNRYAADMAGTTPGELTGRDREQVFSRLFGKHAAPIILQHSVASSIFELSSEEGRRYVMTIAALPHLDEASSSAADAAAHTGESNSWQVMTWSDVTTLAEVQEQLQRSRRLATVGRLAAGVAHEINNPLAAITTCAEAITRDIRRAPATAADADNTHIANSDILSSDIASTHIARFAEDHNWAFYLEEIVRQALRCKAITGGLLDLARERRVRFELVDVNSMIEIAARVFTQSVAGSVRFTVKPDVSIAHVLTDEGMLRQVLDNLISNALHAIAEKNDETGEVTLVTRADGAARVLIEVGDTGAGIAPENLARIFDPFWTTKHTGRGSGLGLAICQMLAEALGGSLTVESKHGAGSRFRLWLPQK